MAARHPETEAISPTQVSIQDLETALEQVTQEVAVQKRQLAATFQQIHQMVAQREGALMAELDAIPAGIAAKLEERRASVEQLSQLREETERQIQANRLNAFLQQQLSGIRTELDIILSEQIPFPRVSISCQIQDIQRILQEKCLVQEIPNPYATRTLPIWSGVKRGDGKGEIVKPTALCIDPTNQLIYVAEQDSGRIQVFTSEGKYHSTMSIHDDISQNRPNSIKIHGDYIYIATLRYLLQRDKSGKLKNFVKTDNKILGLFIVTEKLYTCIDESLTLHLYNLNLKPTNQIPLKIPSDNRLTPSDVIVNQQQIIVLFYRQGFPSQIHIFQLDGTLKRSLATGNMNNSARYFCLDSYENILVSDSWGHCIRVFSLYGRLVQSIGREGLTEPGQLWYPQGIAVDVKGRIIIIATKDDNALQAF